MTIIVEDGTGRSDAESYASVADADSYLAARGIAAWAALTTAAKEIALRAAGDHMLQHYRTLWLGSRQSITQAMDWPRYSVPRPDTRNGPWSYTSYYGITEIPPEVKKACIELALRASTAPLVKDLGAQIDSVSVDVVSVTYTQGAREQARYEAVDRLLAPLLLAGDFSFSLARA